MRESEGGCHELTRDEVEKFVAERLCAYVVDVKLPSNGTAVEEAFRRYLEPAVMEDDALRQAQRGVLMYKPAVSISKHGTRKRANVNVYTHNGKTMTIKPKGQLELKPAEVATSST